MDNRIILIENLWINLPYKRMLINAFTLLRDSHFQVGNESVNNGRLIFRNQLWNKLMNQCFAFLPILLISHERIDPNFDHHRDLAALKYTLVRSWLTIALCLRPLDSKSSLRVFVQAVTLNGENNVG